MRIKDWEHFQHFKDRCPPWIKLYREILDDPDWHGLDGDASKVLVMLWLIASEDKTQKGLLPEPRKLAFRLRMTEKSLNQILTRLDHWLIQDDINVISSCYQPDTPETETETETETRYQHKDDDRFDEFWKLYPKKVGKGAAEKAWAKARVNGEYHSLLAAVKNHSLTDDWLKEGGKYIPHPATWLNQKRWLDEVQQSQVSELFLGAV